MAELRSAGRKIDVPRSEGKKGGISQAADDWAPLESKHDFIRLWQGLKKGGKRLGDLASFDNPVTRPSTPGM